MFIIDFILHIDEHIYNIANAVGGWTYLILFLVIFIETAAVVFPFLPGDSLLFAAGALSANPEMHFNVLLFMLLFFVGALLVIPVIFLLAEPWAIVLYIINFSAS